MTNLEKVKKHFKKHKVAYSCGATAVVVAGITWIIMRGRYTPVAPGKSENSVFVRPFSFLNSSICDSFNQTVVSVVEREGRGSPGYMVRCIETLEEFSTQDKAALLEGVSNMVMSMHVRGKIPDIHGHHYERIPA